MADVTFRYDRAPTGELSGESLVEQTEEALSGLGQSSSHAEEEAARAVEIATEANTKSDQAVTTATQAQTTANSALTTAQSAQTSANQAVQTAQSAVTTAQGASQTAQNAVSTAQSAVTAAQSAQTAAENAESRASTSASAAEGSASSASAAQTAAETAQTSADQAATLATQAQQAAASSAQSAAAAENAAQLLANPNRYSAKTTPLTLSAGQTIDISDLSDSNVAVGNAVIDAVGNIFSIASIDATNNQVTLNGGYWSNPAILWAVHGMPLELVDLGTPDDLPWDEIDAGDFRNCPVGGYVTGTSGNVYYVGHHNYWKTQSSDKNHVLIVPADGLIQGRLNSSDTTAGGYVGCDFKTGNNSNTALANLTTIIEGDWNSSRILTHKEFFVNAVTNGYPSGGAEYDSTIDLMSEPMIYGCKIFEPIGNGSIVMSNETYDKSQIKLFSERPDLITIYGRRWWLRGIVSAARFADVNSVGEAYRDGAGAQAWFRPAFGVCKAQA